eukprot:19882-Heterococcus_DN1.PRE.9
MKWTLHNHVHCSNRPMVTYCVHIVMRKTLYSARGKCVLKKNNEKNGPPMAKNTVALKLKGANQYEPLRHLVCTNREQMEVRGLPAKIRTQLEGKAIQELEGMDKLDEATRTAATHSFSVIEEGGNPVVELQREELALLTPAATTGKKGSGSSSKRGPSESGGGGKKGSGSSKRSSGAGDGGGGKKVKV